MKIRHIAVKTSADKCKKDITCDGCPYLNFDPAVNADSHICSKRRNIVIADAKVRHEKCPMKTQEAIENTLAYAERLDQDFLRVSRAADAAAHIVHSRVRTNALVDQLARAISRQFDMMGTRTKTLPGILIQTGNVNATDRRLHSA